MAERERGGQAVADRGAGDTHVEIAPANPAAAALVVNRLLAESAAKHVLVAEGEDPALQRQHMTEQPLAGVPFAKGAGDASDIEAKDVKQGGLDDCWLMAALMSVARTSPDTIRHLITTRPDGRYDVTLHVVTGDEWQADAGNHVFKHDASFQTVVVTVDSAFPSLMGKAGATPGFARRSGDEANGSPELWPMIYERAVATYRGSYAAVEGGATGSGLETILGSAATIRDLSAPDLLQTLAGLTKRHVAVTFGAALDTDLTDEEKTRMKALGLVIGHIYSLARVDVASGTVDLDNPSGLSDGKALRLDDLRTFFDGYATVGA